MGGVEMFQEARQAIETRQLLSWQGLPHPPGSEGPPARLIFPELPLGGGLRPQRHLGSDFRPADFYVLELPGYHQLMLCLEGETLLLLDGMLPELPGGVAPLLEAYGEPAARLDWWFGTLEVPGGEWVYAGRGISLFLNFDRDRALHLALYAPTSLAHYQQALRPSMRARLIP